MVSPFRVNLVGGLVLRRQVVIIRRALHSDEGDRTDASGEQRQAGGDLNEIAASGTQLAVDALSLCGHLRVHDAQLLLQLSVGILNLAADLLLDVLQARDRRLRGNAPRD